MNMKVFVIAIILSICTIFTDVSAKPKPRAKFYDFGEMLIDGEIKKPTALYTDARQKVRFDRLSRLKKSFIPTLMESSKSPIFK